MNIIIKLIQIIHYCALAIVALCLLVAFSDNNLPQVTFMIFNSLIFKGGSHPTELIVSISFYLLILIPFLKYLIFGKIGWFPDTYVMNKNTKQSIVDDNIEDSINTPKDSIETKKEKSHEELSNIEINEFQKYIDKVIDNYGWDSLRKLNEEDGFISTIEDELIQNYTQSYAIKMFDLFEDAVAIYKNTSNVLINKDIQDTLEDNFFDYVSIIMWGNPHKDKGYMGEGLNYNDIMIYENILESIFKGGNYSIGKQVLNEKFEGSMDLYNSHINNLSKYKGLRVSLRHEFIRYTWDNDMLKKLTPTLNNQCYYVTTWKNDKLNAIAQVYKYFKYTTIVLEKASGGFPKYQNNKYIVTSDMWLEFRYGIQKKPNEVYYMDMESGDGSTQVLVNSRKRYNGAYQMSEKEKMDIESKFLNKQHQMEDEGWDNNMGGKVVIQDGLVEVEDIRRKDYY